VVTQQLQVEHRTGKGRRSTAVPRNQPEASVQGKKGQPATAPLIFGTLGAVLPIFCPCDVDGYFPKLEGARMPDFALKISKMFSELYPSPPDPRDLLLYLWALSSFRIHHNTPFSGKKSSSKT